MLVLVDKGNMFRYTCHYAVMNAAIIANTPLKMA